MDSAYYHHTDRVYAGISFITGSRTSRQYDRQIAVHVHSSRRASRALTGCLAASRVPDDRSYGTLSRIDTSVDKREGQTYRLAEDQE
jgi:hypothetical protein